MGGFHGSRVFLAALDAWRRLSVTASRAAPPLCEERNGSRAPFLKASRAKRRARVTCIAAAACWALANKVVGDASPDVLFAFGWRCVWMRLRVWVFAEVTTSIAEARTSVASSLIPSSLVPSVPPSLGTSLTLLTVSDRTVGDPVSSTSTTTSTCTLCVISDGDRGMCCERTGEKELVVARREAIAAPRDAAAVGAALANPNAPSRRSKCTLKFSISTCCCFA